MARLFTRLRMSYSHWHCVAAFAGTLAASLWGGPEVEAAPKCLRAAALASTTAENSGGRFVISNNCRNAVSVQFCVRHRSSKWPCPTVTKHVRSSTRAMGVEAIWYSISPYSYDGRYSGGPRARTNPPLCGGTSGRRRRSPAPGRGLQGREVPRSTQRLGSGGMAGRARLRATQPVSVRRWMGRAAAHTPAALSLITRQGMAVG